MFTYICSECNKSFEYGKSKALPKSMMAPEDLACPECKKPNLLVEKFEGFGGFDIKGWSPDNEHGKRNWKRGKSAADIASVYLDESVNPY